MALLDSTNKKIDNSKNVHVQVYTKSYLNNAFNTTHDMQSNTKTNKAYNNITLIFKKEN